MTGTWGKWGENLTKKSCNDTDDKIGTQRLRTQVHNSGDNSVVRSNVFTQKQGSVHKKAVSYATVQKSTRQR